MKFISLKVDEKGRIQLPKELRDDLGIDGDVLAEQHADSLEIKAKPQLKDPLEFLSSIRLKSKKTPVELKREADDAIADSV